MTNTFKKILVTGGCGFIGSNFVRLMLNNYPDLHIVNLDKLTYAGERDNLIEFETDRRYRFILGDIIDQKTVTDAMEGCEAIVHFAAESHVDRSIHNPIEFIQTNVLGTFQLLQSAKAEGIKRFVHVSTDEVYGSLGVTGYFTEESPLAPNSPYSASKASSDLLVRSYVHTFKFPAVITRCSNNYGPYQHPEKLLPLMMTQALNNKRLPVYGDGLNIRDWLYVEDHCEAINCVLHKGRAGEVYNIGGNNEWKNIDVVKLLLKDLKKPETLIEFVKDRPGHDRRYAIDASKIKKELGWEPKTDFPTGLQKTIHWYKTHENWIEKIKQKGATLIFNH